MTRHEVLGQLGVFVLLIVSVTGSALVLYTKNGGHRLMPIADGAFPGGVIAMGGAAAFIVAAVLLRSKSAVAFQLVCSILLGVLHIVSLLAVQDRVAGGEPTNGSVEWGAVGYLIAIALQVVATVIAIVRVRRMPAD